MKVAIDGPAGSGKSTVAHALSDRLGFVMLDTGAMYRAVTLACLREEIDVTNEEDVARIAGEMAISFGKAQDGTQTVSANGEDVTRDIRTPEVDANVSAVSAIPAVREAMVAQQRAIGEAGDVVAEGRDIGTVVFPDAEVKVFLTASAEARAHRRALQRTGGDAATDPNATAGAEAESEVLDELVRRDEADSTRAVSPLRPADDAHLVDSSDMTLSEVVDCIVALVNQARDGEANDTPTTAETAHTSEADKPVEAEQSRQTESDADGATAGEQQSEDAGDKPNRKGLFKLRGIRRKKKRESGVEDEQKEPKDEQDREADDDKQSFKTLEEYYEAPIREFPRYARTLLGASVGVCGALSKTLWHWSVEGGEKLWKADGGRVVVMNHVSMLDPVLAVVTDWAHGRRMRPIYKSEFDSNKLVMWFFARIGAIPVKRGTADIKAVRRAQRALQRGEDVLVFPEGTRIKSDDQEVTLHGGFALMAQLAKVPVIPMAIVGARDGAPGGNKPLRPGRVWIRVGDEITFDELDVKGRKQQAKEMERVAMERVYAMRDELREEHPGKM